MPSTCDQTDPCRHYQLRHFISCPEPDLLYYASGCDVYCLNTATRTQAHVTTLPWDARCTAAGHGYICVGGADDGNFAAIKVTGFPPVDPSDIDASLPLDFEQRLPRPPLLGAATRIRLEKIGEDIVNSISIHKLPPRGDDPEEVVAVLTNNDKTVRIYSLAQNLELMVLDLPFAMNHATISPDGQMLVAVGDAPVAFFFQRAKCEKGDSGKTSEEHIQSNPPEWELLEQVTLYRPVNSHAEGYFTTAWSPSGRLCAVGSECGYITVFDVDLLKIVEYGEDAIVQLISSTRPNTVTSAGAVRTMHFSPAPWDFLVWSEDQGRVCVADLRAGLKVKQVLTLDTKEAGLETVTIADFDLTLSPEMHELRREADFLRGYRRALDSEGTAAAVNHANNYFEADSERHRLHQRLGVVESDDDPHGLTAHERLVLEALRTTRQREEAHEQGVTPRSINYTPLGQRETLPYSSAPRGG
jgi:WD40 repeat protein